MRIVAFFASLLALLLSFRGTEPTSLRSGSDTSSFRVGHDGGV
jgi:hypothetical protein